MLRIAIYYNHYNTLGHSTRMFSLVEGLKKYFKRNIEIVILQGGKKQNILPFTKYSQHYILPYSIDKRGLFIEESVKIYKKMISSGGMNNMLKERLSFIKKILDKFNPDIFITEYFPFGQEFWTFEVPYILRYLKDNFICKIIGSCGYINCIDNTYNYIKEFYDALFIHSPKDFSKGYELYLHERGAEELNRVFADFSEKIYFTGFILQQPKINSYKNIRAAYLNSRYKKLILVSRGGGIVNKKILLAAMLVAKRNRDLYFVVSCGPATSHVEFREYKKFSKDNNNLKLVRVIYPTNFDAHIKAADLCINMAGYNTTARLLYYGKKAILIPYYTSEQRWRADLVRKYLPSRIIPEKDLNISLLEKNMFELLEENSRPVKIDKNWFSGISNTIEALKCQI